MKKGIVLAAAACLAAPTFANNYVDISLGASKYYSIDSDTNDGLKDFDASPALKITTGGRLNESRTIWFELGAIHNGKMDNGFTTLSSQTLFTGLKLTTNPAANSSVFLKAGIGKTWTEISTNGSNAKENSKENTAYSAIGLSFRLSSDNALLFEAQHSTDTDSDIGLNGLFISYSSDF